jgi:hypothetical protein
VAENRHGTHPPLHGAASGVAALPPKEPTIVPDHLANEGVFAR